MKITHFNDLNMHDSEIKSMTIWPGGDIVIYLTYIEDYDTMITSQKKLILVLLRNLWVKKPQSTW